MLNCANYVGVLVSGDGLLYVLTINKFAIVLVFIQPCFGVFLRPLRKIRQRPMQNYNAVPLKLGPSIFDKIQIYSQNLSKALKIEHLFIETPSHNK